MSGCSTQSTTMGPQVIYTQKTTATWLVHVFSAPESTTDLGAARASVENRASSGAMKSRAYYRTSNDGATWDTWTSLYADGTNEQSNDGISYGPDYVSLLNSVKAKQLIQWGVGVVNTSGSATELATTTLKIDRKR